MHTIVLLTLSNVFMTIAWYGHLNYKDTPLWMAILVSWGLAAVLYLREPLKWNYLWASA